MNICNSLFCATERENDANVTFTIGNKIFITDDVSSV